MGHQLIPPPELAPPSIGHLPVAKRIEIWAQLVDESDALVISNLRARLPPGDDWREAYRQWYARRMEKHNRAQIQLLQNLTRRERGDGE